MTSTGTPLCWTPLAYELLVVCRQREVSVRVPVSRTVLKFRANVELEWSPSTSRSRSSTDFDYFRGLMMGAHLGTFDSSSSPPGGTSFLPRPPGTGRTHLAIGIAIRVCQAGHRVQFGAASAWVARRVEAHHAGHLQLDLVRLGRHRLLVVASAASATDAEDAGFDLARQRPFDVTGRTASSSGGDGFSRRGCVSRCRTSVALPRRARSSRIRSAPQAAGGTRARRER